MKVIVMIFIVLFVLALLTVLVSLVFIRNILTSPFSKKELDKGGAEFEKEMSDAEITSCRRNTGFRIKEAMTGSFPFTATRTVINLCFPTEPLSVKKGIMCFCRTTEDTGKAQADISAWAGWIRRIF